MNLTYRKATEDDIDDLKKLAAKSWLQFQSKLTPENWAKLLKNLTDENTYAELLKKSESIVCLSGSQIVGMAFLVPSGNPTELCEKEWSYLRLVSVDPDFAGRGIGRRLTTHCIEVAKRNGEKIIALHTSELMANARHIYESLGFKILREIDRRFEKRYWLYKLEITDNE